MNAFKAGIRKLHLKHKINRENNYLKRRKLTNNDFVFFL